MFYRTVALCDVDKLICLFFIFCCYFIHLKARQISRKIWETRKVFLTLLSALCDSQYWSFIVCNQIILENVSFFGDKENLKTYQTVRNVPFSENLACFVFLWQPFWDSAFCLITDDLVECILCKCLNFLSRQWSINVFTINKHKLGKNEEGSEPIEITISRPKILEKQFLIRYERMSEDNDYHSSCCCFLTNMQYY